MELNAFVLINMISVSHGNILMGINVYTSKTGAQLVQDGISSLVILLTIALLDFMEKRMLVNHSLKDVFLQLSGKMGNV